MNNVLSKSLYWLMCIAISLLISCKDSYKKNEEKTNKKEEHEIIHTQIKLTDSSLQSFIPKGFNVIYSATGDTNLDGIEDVILVLAPVNEASISDFENNKPAKRITRLLVGTNEGGYTLKLQSDKMVECIDCSGLVADAFKYIKIDNKGQIILHHEVMAEQYWSETRTFQYNKKEDNWELSKDHFVSYRDDKQTGNIKEMKKGHELTENTKDFGKITIDKFNIYATDRR